MKFKVPKFAFCVANQFADVSARPDAANLNVRAAPLGTYAEYDTGRDRLPL